MRLSGTKATAVHQYRGLGNQLWDLAGNRPSLDLPFADSKSLVDATTGTTLVDHTRASSGTYVGSDGLIKTATTNYLRQSEDFSTTWITLGSPTVNTNTWTAPNGIQSGDTITVGSDSVTVGQDISVLSSTSYTLSFYLNTALTSVAFVRIRFAKDGGASGNVWLSPSTLTFDNYQAGVSGGTAVLVAPNVYRISVLMSFGATDGGARRISIGGTTASGSGTSDSGKDIAVWGAQLEQSSTVGEYIPTTSTINSAPRFDHDPTTGESLGLLVEESRTNLLLRSEEFDNASWGKLNSVTISANAVESPDGRLTADKLVESASNALQRITQAATISLGSPLSLSLYIKAAERTTCTFGAFTTSSGNVSASIDLSAKTVSVTASIAYLSATASLVELDSGWFRVLVQVATSGITSATVFFNTGFGAYQGDGTSGIYIWGAQLEAGAFPTSYIPTTTATVTRSADVASISGSNFSSWYRQDEGTFSYQWRVPSATVPSNIFSVSDGTNNNRHQHYSESNSILVRTASSGAASNNGVGLSSANSFTKVSFGYGSGTTSASDNGTAVTTSTQTIPTNIATAYLGASAAGAVGQAVILSRITYWPQRLPDSTLQQITQ